MFYGRVVNSHDASIVVGFGQEARLSTCFVDNTINLPWRKCPKFQSLGQSSRGKYRYFWDIRISLQDSVGQVEEMSHAKSQLDAAIR